MKRPVDCTAIAAAPSIFDITVPAGDCWPGPNGEPSPMSARCLTVIGAAWVGMTDAGKTRRRLVTEARASIKRMALAPAQLERLVMYLSGAALDPLPVKRFRHEPVYLTDKMPALRVGDRIASVGEYIGAADIGLEAALSLVADLPIGGQRDAEAVLAILLAHPGRLPETRQRAAARRMCRYVATAIMGGGR